MTKEELKNKIELYFENAEKMLVKQGSLIPMLDVEFVDENGKDCVMAVVMANDNKDKFIRGFGLVMGAIQRLGKIKEVKCIVMMSEAWFSSPSKEEYKKNPNQMPSQDPNRREMLMAVGLTADGKCLMHSKEMFSILVKGKRHFTLKEVPELNMEKGKMQSNVLDNFFFGFKKALEDSEKNKFLDLIAPSIKDTTLNEVLERAIKALTSSVGGLDYQIIKK
jgi:hypothetical protein